MYFSEFGRLYNGGFCPWEECLVSIGFSRINSCVVFRQFCLEGLFDDNFESRHASTKLFPRTPPEISSQKFWCNKNFQKKSQRKFYRMCTRNLKVLIWLSNLYVTIVILLLFTQFMNALIISNTNLGKKLPKSDATIKRKNEDATVKQSS